jgi:hypothetical protein
VGQSSRLCPSSCWVLLGSGEVWPSALNLFCVLAALLCPNYPTLLPGYSGVEDRPAGKQVGPLHLDKVTMMQMLSRSWQVRHSVSAYPYTKSHPGSTLPPAGAGGSTTVVSLDKHYASAKSRHREGHVRGMLRVGLILSVLCAVVVPRPLGVKRLLAPIALTLLAYLPCLNWGLLYASIGSWRSKVSNLHRLGGVATLILPLAFVVFEALTSTHVPRPLYIAAVLLIALNLGAGTALISRRIPAYDIPTLRAFAVGVLLGTSFLGLSLMFWAGPIPAYEPVGRVLALVGCYSVVYAWSDAVQHLHQYLKGNFKAAIGKSVYTPSAPLL